MSVAPLAAISSGLQDGRMASKKKGTTVPLDQFLKPDTKITSWAEDEDFDADSKPCRSVTRGLLCATPCDHHMQTCGMQPRAFCLESHRLCRAVPVSPLPTRSTAPAAEPMHDTFKSQSDLPDQPPYKVYIGNVPYELTKDDLSDVFKDLQASLTTLFTC